MPRSAPTEQDPHASGAEERQPPPALAAGRIPVGGGVLAIEASHPLDRPLPGIRYALVVIHGMLRNADVYQASGEAAAGAAREAGAILVATPQFLAADDIAHHGGEPALLHWSYSGWKAGEAALGPAPVSAFAALDAVIAHLADRQRLPDLKRIVMAGHSAGGQILQRYIAVRQGAAGAVPLRFVVANPSSYLYFSPARPQPDGSFAAVGHPDVDRWRYGLDGRPLYAAALAPAEIERRYVAADVTYLLGRLDCDPEHPSLDRSPAAAAQGPSRLERGRAYWRYLQGRHPNLRHRLVEIDGVGHDGRGMFTAPAGLAALFGSP